MYLESLLRELLVRSTAARKSVVVEVTQVGAAVSESYHSALKGEGLVVQNKEVGVADRSR